MRWTLYWNPWFPWAVFPMLERFPDPPQIRLVAIDGRRVG